MSSIKENIDIVRKRIHTAEIQFHRKANAVTLLAASKTQSIEKMLEAIAAGQHIFGENYVQEALKKIESLKAYPIEWHFIGTLQRNKTRPIAEHFSWVHTVSEPIMAERLNEQRPDHLPPLNICIEVNVSHESTKSGVNYADVKELALLCTQLPRLKLRGLMTIPAMKSQFIDQRSELYKLRLLDEFLRNEGFILDTLSMGMSDDLEAAIAENSTMVRIGTAIFGPRA